MTSFLALRASVCVSNSPGMLFLFFPFPFFLGGGPHFSLVYRWPAAERLLPRGSLLFASSHRDTRSQRVAAESNSASWPNGQGTLLYVFLTPVRAQFCTGASSDSNPRFWPDGRRVGCSRHGDTSSPKVRFSTSKYT